MTTADIDSGRIIVRPSFADLFVCRQIPGSRWDAARRAWSLPATVATATLLRKKLRSVSESDRFKLLLTTSITIKLDGERTTALPAGAVVPSNVVPLVPHVPDAFPGPRCRYRRNRRSWSSCPPACERNRGGTSVSPTNSVSITSRQGLHGILLAMGMGTGKSLVACMLLLGLAAKRVLISCPLRVVPVWLTQFERHVAIDMVVVALDEDIGSVVKKMELAQEKMRLAEARGVPFVAVINYDSAWREPFAAWAEKQRWDLVIADEAHRIKAPGGKASMFFKRLRTKALHRVLLTGTPMPHGPMDIYAPLRFADITIFGPSFAAFRQKYAVMGGYQRKQITGFQQLDELER